jgi:hypothetical protein
MPVSAGSRIARGSSWSGARAAPVRSTVLRRKAVVKLLDLCRILRAAGRGGPRSTGAMDRRLPSTTRAAIFLFPLSAGCDTGEAISTHPGAGHRQKAWLFGTGQWRKRKRGMKKLNPKRRKA